MSEDEEEVQEPLLPLPDGAEFEGKTAVAAVDFEEACAQSVKAGTLSPETVLVHALNLAFAGPDLRGDPAPRFLEFLSSGFLEGLWLHFGRAHGEGALRAVIPGLCWLGLGAAASSAARFASVEEEDWTGEDLVAALAGADPRARAALCLALSGIPNREAGLRIVPFLSDPDPDVREEAADALYFMSDGEDIDYDPDDETTWKEASAAWRDWLLKYEAKPG